LEPSTLLIVGFTYVAAQIGRKVGDEVAGVFWTRAKSAWAKVFATEPHPAAVTHTAINTVAEAAPDLSDALQNLLRDAPVLRRLRRVPDAVAGSRILWVDDHPEGNSWEIACLEAAGASIRIAETTRTALQLAADGYDIIISDIARGSDPAEGLKALPVLHNAAPAAPVILYVGRREAGVPAGAFGITNRPDDLLHLVMDALERKRL
jgi:CheY-like chemotaxis protein